LLQVLTVALAAPGVTGVIATVEARLQGRRGPRIRQPYYDLAWKHVRSEVIYLRILYRILFMITRLFRVAGRGFSPRRSRGHT
jgi:formate hydrogenlyase subunit 4